MSRSRWLLVVVGTAMWGVGVWRFAVAGDYVAGGLLVLAGGLCLVIAASGGWSEFWHGALNWLYFWR